MRVFLQAKLHQIHLVVIQNRLEQLRQRQREQALKVQEELGGTLAEAELVAEMQNRPEERDEADEDDLMAEEAEEVEEYSRDMSPEPLQAKQLKFEDRSLPIVNEEDDMRALVSSRYSMRRQSFAFG